jgi:hypothetical protein
MPRSPVLQMTISCAGGVDSGGATSIFEPQLARSMSMKPAELLDRGLPNPIRGGGLPPLGGDSWGVDSPLKVDSPGLPPAQRSRDAEPGVSGAVPHKCRRLPVLAESEPACRILLLLETWMPLPGGPRMRLGGS